MGQGGKLGVSLAGTSLGTLQPNLPLEREGLAPYNRAPKGKWISSTYACGAAIPAEGGIQGCGIPGGKRAGETTGRFPG